MSCNDDTQVNRVPGQWVKMSDQGTPPNASAADRQQATQSASRAADDAANSNCALGHCHEEKHVCAAEPDSRATRTFEYEETTGPNGSFIRALCSMRYHCECHEAPKGGGKGEGGGKKKGKLRRLR